ncbi:DUF3426 domain-containing protein [Marinomonas sp. 2405UD68-3]|uniref:DUF3426 domain-containing protein n=1 Tax=Marinomonas sp. 2405UD68-3 TaxID=3391835 RepID=UPI0039C997BD
MTDSIITRCPKCSTAFRVGTDILSMAKGRVRCGQCFHIFEAKPIKENPPTPATSEKVATTETAPEQPDKSEHKQGLVKPSKKPFFSAAEEDHQVSPEWLHTLFDDSDLTPIDKHNHEANLNKQSQKAIEKNKIDHDDSYEQNQCPHEEPAPWEREFAELEPINTSTLQNKRNTNGKETLQTQNTSLSPSVQIYNESIKNLGNTTKKEQEEQTSKSTELQSYVEEVEEPDYMKALHTLAQSTSDQRQNTQEKTNKARKEAQERLAPLISNEDTPLKKNHSLLWLFGILLSMTALSFQAAFHFFDDGSRSATFRPFYKTFCSYVECTLPNFVDISAISIQHVRIQSHPTKKNALLVNAIMTNTSNYSQTMPKIALEFFDLNGVPVAARLFSPNSFLHKDFLDITYMPPNTPIHIVLPIYDPGTQAVTHRLKVHASDTQSY